MVAVTKDEGIKVEEDVRLDDSGGWEDVLAVLHVPKAALQPALQ